VKKGDIVLIPFPFSDLTGSKLRPALVLISTEYDVTVCFITTQFQWKEKPDIELIPSSTNGLKKLSLLRTNKFTTIDKELILGRIGSLENNYLHILNINLIEILQLD
jgi:mRNA interferase MazF